MARTKPLILLILDGFGISLEKQGNPVAEASTPTLNKVEQDFPFITLHASGIAVGLPWGEAGNSEVGHLTIGSGRVLYHHLPRIINSIRDNSFFNNEALKKAATHVKTYASAFHIAGLVSSGSAHSYIEHIWALLEFTKREGLQRVYLHVFTDGKDSPPKEGAEFIRILEQRMRKEYPHARIASVVGRFFAMDRDERWDRIESAYRLLAQREGQKITSIFEYLSTSYQENLTDEFIKPAVVTVEGGETMKPIGENDALVFFNFREDSMREIVRTFVADHFPYFPRKKIKNLFVVTMTEYQQGLPSTIPAFPPLEVKWPLARILGEKGISHLHIAETEKYAHVTYFLNGGREDPFPEEERVLIPSFSTPHFDEVPEMRAPEITERILEHFKKYDVIIANLANADLVGHSGNFRAAIAAVEAIDTQVGRITAEVLEKGGTLLITADHGNIELKRDVLTGEKLTEHSTNPVPFYLVGKEYQLVHPRTREEILEQKSQVRGILTDVAPTVLELLELEKPAEMTGRSLLSTLLERSPT